MSYINNGSSLFNSRLRESSELDKSESAVRAAIELNVPLPMSEQLVLVLESVLIVYLLLLLLIILFFSHISMNNTPFWLCVIRSNPPAPTIRR